MTLFPFILTTLYFFDELNVMVQVSVYCDNRYPRYSSSFRRAVHNLIWQNYIELWGNLLKDKTILDIKQCYVNINSSSNRRDDQIFDEQTNTKQDLKNGSCYKKVKVSCEAMSSVKYKQL